MPRFDGTAAAESRNDPGAGQQVPPVGNTPIAGASGS